MDEEKSKKKNKKDEAFSDDFEIRSNLFGSRGGYTDDIFSTIKNTGLEVSTPEIWDTDLSNLTNQNRSSVMRHIGKTMKLIEDKEAANNAAIQNRMNHPFLKNPFFYVFIAYGIFMAFSLILLFL